MGPARDPPRLHAWARRRSARHAARPRRAAVVARPMAIETRRRVQERPSDAVRMAGGALLPWSDHASLAGSADDLFGPAALALLRSMVPCRRAFHHRHLAVAAA